MRRQDWLISAGAMAAVLLSAAPALAQQGLPPPGPPPDAQGGPPTPAEQSDRLRQALRLRPDQEGALQAFVAAMQPKPGEIDALRGEAARDASLPTPQRLDATIERLDRMRTEVLARIAATRAFYALLSPEQQRVFDHMPNPGR
ncbi:MAG TPA: Spy/CpxP family protein refolding chaperone [Caulobacteraceae bacterium]